MASGIKQEDGSYVVAGAEVPVVQQPNLDSACGRAEAEKLEQVQETVEETV